jgi:solute:Na+ symporter, SSS family
MHFLDIDVLIISSFLFLTLAVGLWAGRGVQDMREYAIANKQFGTGVLTMTILATYITGSKGIGYVGYVFDDGILPVFSLLFCGAIITFLWIAWCIAPRMHHFVGCWTLPELMGLFYGQKARFWMGILGTCYSVALVALQMIWLGYVGVLFNLPSQLSIFLGGFFLVVYAARGGMKAVAVTDVLQFIAILVFVPLVAYAVLYRVGGVKALFSQVPTTVFDVLHHPSRRDYVFYCIWDLFPAFPLSFPFIQRMLTARDKTQLVHSYYISLSFLTVFYVLLTLIGLAAIALRTTVDVNMPAQGSNVFVYIVKHYLPVGARGVIGAGFIAGIMSTADSFLHTAGVALVHDVLQPSMRQPINVLRLTRRLTFFLGLIALLLALCYKVLPREQYGGVDLGRGLNFITEVIALVFTIPLVAGIMGLKTTPRAFFVASVVTVMVFVLSKFCISHEYIIPVAIAANALSFFGMHYFQHRGFVVVNRAEDQQKSRIWHPTWQGASRSLLRLVPTPKKLLSYSQHSLEKYGANPTLFALFMSLSYMIPFFMHGYAAPAAYNWLLGLRGIGALLCVGLLLKSYWPKQLLAYFPIYYHVSLLYCLPCTASFIFLLEGSSIECLINITLAILLLITLVDWVTFVLLTLLGSGLGIVVYSMLLGIPIATPDSDTLYTLVYTLTFSTLIGLLFARRKQLHFDTLATQRERLTIDNQEAKEDLLEATEEKFRFVGVLKKAGIEQLGSVAHLSKRLLALSKKGGNNKEVTTLAQQLTDQLMPMALSMDRFSHRTTGFLLLDRVETISLDNFLQALQQALCAKGQRLKIEVSTQHKTLQCDVEKIRKVVLNSVAFIHSVAGEDDLVLLGVADTQLGYDMDSVSPDHIKKISALRFTITVARALPKLAVLYMSQIGEESLMQPEVPTNLPLLANERIVRAHYGYSGTIGERDGLTLVYVIPVNVREVRSKDMDTPQMQLGASWSRANDTYPGAQAQESAFLKAVQERSKADLTLVKKAINVIKDYHGPIMRESGEPFYLHPMAVAQIVLDYNQEETSILGALLHDTVEDTPLTLEQVALLFNEEVRTIVQGVTHMESNKATNYKVLLSHPENIHKLLEAEDKRVLYVKLADRMHNLRTLKAKPYESQRRIAEETLLFFVPLAKYLHLSEAAEELKHRSFDMLGSV